MHYTFYPLAHFSHFSLFLPLFFIYTCGTHSEYAWSRVGVHTVTLAHGGPKLMLDFFLDCSPVPQAVSSTDPELTNSAR